MANFCLPFHVFEDISASLDNNLQSPLSQSFKGTLPTNEPKDHLRVVLREKATA